MADVWRKTGMKEFNEKMTSTQLTSAYFKVILDPNRTDEEKEEAEKEYNRLMDLIMSSDETIMA